MIKRLQEKWKKIDLETGLFLLILFGMAVYYGWRLFALTPWYDELYTYYYFISRGPIYAAIHWPLPNNHVGFSVLSAILDLFGNAAIGLRGVSWLCSLISLCLLFAISKKCFSKKCFSKKCFSKGLALIPIFLFASMELVNLLAVQGRGYALATCLYLTALYELLCIVKEHDCRRRNYIVLACAFIWALYTLPSSVYFVVPLCVIGGVCLLMERRNKEFVTLFVTSLISAISTIALYAVIWLAIGSNLLSKMPEGGFYEQGHISIILHSPFLALKTGIEYMLDTPYIQSVARDGYLSGFVVWIKELFEYYYSGMSVILLLLMVIGIVMVIIRLIKEWKNRNAGQNFLEWYLLLSFVLTPLMLIIQAALPYYRVFSFFGVPVALFITWLLSQMMACSKSGKPAYAVTALAGLMCIMILASPLGRAQYSEREASIEDVCRHINLEKGETVCVTDCDQEYLLKYLFDLEEVCRTVEEADYVLLDKDLFLSDDEIQSRDAAGADAWKYYISHDEIPWDYFEDKMDICYENYRFILYIKRN